LKLITSLNHEGMKVALDALLLHHGLMIKKRKSEWLRHFALPLFF